MDVSCEKNVICEYCNEKFLFHKKLKYHKCFYHKDGYPCNVCGKKFPTGSHLITHSATHSGEKPFKCHVCDKRFRFKSSLYPHMAKHRENEKGDYVKEVVADKSFPCVMCNKKYSNITGLKRHYLYHTKEKPYVCDICHRGFTLKGNMENHFRLHFTNEKSFKCEKCNKCFNRKSNLTVHYDMHYRKENGLPPRKIVSKEIHKCDTCLKTFISRRNLIQHQVSHTKVKTFVCELCNQEFSYNSSLKRHLSLHSKNDFKNHTSHWKKVTYSKNSDGFYVCNTCKKTFVEETELHAHKKSFLLESKSYKCCKCLIVYNAKKSLREHQKIHETDEDPLPNNMCIVTVAKD